ncbi:dihydrofolate reductase family protein [Deinococcus koreensis]|uniref:Dihydrofolate reductase n=1 Tax=Deinococcus koreensis TaxID=2054903 RepID=A0A2K3URM7_9DEIO|nr:dihydrofolate reductase family protein [Deinococcus koreensis]PNY79199.1 dihydrofolate reductase [Deinococcus koreensis]
MRKVVLFVHASLDGKVQGPAPWDLGWIRYGPDLEHFASQTLADTSTVIWGRVTYEGMLNHWPKVAANPGSSDYERQHAAWLDATEKVVVSTTTDRSDWSNTRFVARDVPEEVLKLKQEEGGDITVVGSPSVAHLLMRRDLIDEYRLTVSPMVLGRGTDLAAPEMDRQNLQLAGSEAFPSGLLGLTYRRGR